MRFLGRKLYAALVVVLLSAMLHGLNAEEVGRIRQLLNTKDMQYGRSRAAPATGAARRALLPEQCPKR